MNTINNILKKFDEDFDLDSMGQSEHSIANSAAGSVKPDENNIKFMELMKATRNLVLELNEQEELEIKQKEEEEEKEK